MVDLEVTLVEDKIEFSISDTLYKGGKSAVYSIEEAENLLILVKDRIYRAREVRERIIEKKIADLDINIVQKEAEMKKLVNDLKEIRDKLGK